MSSVPQMAAFGQELSVAVWLEATASWPKLLP